jgi:hypothetical protein
MIRYSHAMTCLMDITTRKGLKLYLLCYNLYVMYTKISQAIRAEGQARKSGQFVQSHNTGRNNWRFGLERRRYAAHRSRR